MMTLAYIDGPHYSSPRHRGKAPKYKTEARPLPTVPVAGHAPVPCLSCGKTVHYFLSYQLCDKCLMILPEAVYKPAFSLV